MLLYVDTSCLAKLYLEEDFSAESNRLVRDAEMLVTSCVTYPEMLSALERRRRSGALVGVAFERAVDNFRRQWLSFIALPVYERLAGDLTLAHGLRGFDAVHLAAAVTTLRAKGGQQLMFLAFDRMLVAAAKKEGLRVAHVPRADEANA